LIWFTTRTDAGDWDEPKLLAADLGAKQAGLSVTVANSGAIYTSGIVRLRPVDGKYAVAEKLPAYLDGSYPFIAPDESYIVYCSGKNRDLVVSFHQPDRSWTEPKLLLGQQKPFWVQGFPSVSPDGRYLFFTADHDIYWVSAGILEDLRPDGLR